MGWQETVKTIAPMLGTALGGPLGGFAVGVLADALGVEEKTADSIKAALSGSTPEQILAIKNAEREFALKMQEAGFKNVTDLEALAVADRKDARAMQALTSSNIPAVLSVFVTVGYFSVLVGMMTDALKVSDSQALLMMLSQLGTAWVGIMAFWFGTTFNSGKKTDLLAKSPVIKE